MRTYVISGASSGIGAATAARLEADGHRVIGIDLSGSTIDADLSNPAGRQAAVDAVTADVDVLDGLVTCAGLAGLPGRPGSIIASLNYFGSVALFDGLLSLLQRSDQASAVAISSNSMTTTPLVDHDLVDLLLASNEADAMAKANDIGSIAAYPTSKAAIAQWVRARAITPEWTGAGVTLNAVAPGVTETAMVAETRADPTIGHFFDQFPIPLGRGARPDEIAAMITFLLGPDARFMCGSVVFVDGGTDALSRVAIV